MPTSYRRAPAFVVIALVLAARPGPAAAVKPGPLVVPTQFPTIQSAVDAASAGATIQILAGTYTEQVLIDKSLTIVGAGKDSVVIRAPSALRRNKAKEGNIVDITGGASVFMSRLTVAGPGSGTCKKGALSSGIRVRDGANLNLTFASIRDIHDTPFVGCFHSAHGVLVGDVPGPSASATIDHTEITNYQGSGIVILGFGSTATITHNTIAGPGLASGVATDGIEFPVGSVGTVAHNTVSGNQCPPTDPTCGPDWFTQFQHAGIGAGGWGPGMVVTDNLLFDNQVGLLLGESDEIRDNVMVDNDFFGLALFDGEFVVDGGSVSGGGGGLWMIADSANTNVTLNGVAFSGLGGPTVDKVECCGFVATVTINP
jgi:Right handed beta helix region